MYKIVKRSANINLQAMIDDAQEDYRQNRDPDSPRINGIERRINSMGDPRELAASPRLNRSATSGRFFVLL